MKRDIHRDQRSMQRDADRVVRDRCRAFNEIMTGPNPLTPSEVHRLIAKHPARYGMFSAFGKESP